MSEGRDPAIKLFGKTIQLPDGVFSQDAVSGDGGGAADGTCVKSEDRSSSASSSSEVGEERQSDDNNNKDQPEEKTIDNEENRPNSTASEEVTDPNATSMISDNTKTPSSTNQNESATAKASKSEEEQSELSNNNQEKTLKKPDKILPCPRCNSMDTKFCYYNNYNVNQPRHFCKNCQRYWTAGGTMRNVPVGAGRRKNKTSASQYRQITVTEALPIELNHTVLKFGSSDTPLCESMASVLKIAEKNSFRKPEELIIPVPNDDNTNRPSPEIHHGFSPQMPPCFPGAPWPPYPWTPQMGPAFCPPGFPMPFYPGPYWGCAVPVPVPGPGPGPGSWWVSPPANYHVPPPPPPPSGPMSPTLGKHSREENIVKSDGGEDSTKENEPEKSLWVPKTLRIDDPDEAAKSSIWATLGIKNDRSGGIFKAFQSKNEEKKQQQMQETSPALQANPAALSRSLNFQESS